MQNLDEKRARELVKTYQPIPDLKPGEKLDLKPEIADLRKCKGPIIVQRLVNIVGPVGDMSNRARIADFTFLLVDEDDGELLEFFGDSREYERVE